MQITGINTLLKSWGTGWSLGNTRQIAVASDSSKDECRYEQVKDSNEALNPISLADGVSIALLSAFTKPIKLFETKINGTKLLLDFRPKPNRG